MGQKIRSVQLLLPSLMLSSLISCQLFHLLLKAALKSYKDNNIPYQMYIKTETRF
jgi:hypothetical protein